MSVQRKPSPDDLPAMVRARDLRELGFTRIDAERIMHDCGRHLQMGKAVYVHREDVHRVIAEREKTAPC